MAAARHGLAGRHAFDDAKISCDGGELNNSNFWQSGINERNRLFARIRFEPEGGLQRTIGDENGGEQFRWIVKWLNRVKRWLARICPRIVVHRKSPFPIGEAIPRCRIPDRRWKNVNAR